MAYEEVHRSRPDLIPYTFSLFLQPCLTFCYSSIVPDKLSPQSVCRCNRRPRNAFVQIAVGHSLISLSFFPLTAPSLSKSSSIMQETYIYNTPPTYTHSISLSIPLLCFSVFLVFIMSLSCIQLQTNK